jgi:hypothetical protein
MEQQKTYSLPLNENGNGLYDTPGFVQNMRNIACSINVHGAQDVYNMNLLIQGLEHLRKVLIEQRDREAEHHV